MYEIRCRDGVINDFLSWCRHLLVPFLFHEVTSLHPPSFQRNDFSTCSIADDVFSIRCHDIPANVTSMMGSCPSLW